MKLASVPKRSIASLRNAKLRERGRTRLDRRVDGSAPEMDHALPADRDLTRTYENLQIS